MKDQRINKIGWLVLGLENPCPLGQFIAGEMTEVQQHGWGANNLGWHTIGVLIDVPYKGKINSIRLEFKSISSMTTITEQGANAFMEHIAANNEQARIVLENGLEVKS